ncbi:hypothetical protein LOK49_LG10G00152 [Camellia lanceoleosa]|uniref:Uncharacterized protein n=1 Tax=Camellia lanceoleosa TaxID=1840588 RepID=A0ACC0G8F8_9ERIC|nr:hypothetical protein LOK49_LG10G00152 [Camellia lanceoleosa]
MQEIPMIELFLHSERFSEIVGSPYYMAPEFFLSKEKDNPTFRSLSLSGVRSFFGIGTAVLFKGSSSCASAEWSSIKRYLSLDSTLVRAYGFIDVDFDIESSSMKHTRGSFCLFIPEDDSSPCTFEEAVQSYELALYQATHHFWPTIEKCHNKCINSTLRKFNVIEDKNTYMILSYLQVNRLIGLVISGSGYAFHFLNLICARPLNHCRELQQLFWQLMIELKSAHQISFYFSNDLSNISLTASTGELWNFCFLVLV